MKHPSGAYDQIFITVTQLRVCWCGALSLTRGRVCSLQLLLVLASSDILGSKSLGTRDHILLSQFRDFLFVASYDSQGHGGGIRPRLHTGDGFLLYNVGTDRRKTPFIFVSTEMFVDHPYPVITETFPPNGLFSKNPSPWKCVCRLVP
jgi:hypothetical protein